MDVIIKGCDQQLARSEMGLINDGHDKQGGLMKLMLRYLTRLRVSQYGWHYGLAASG